MRKSVLVVGLLLAAPAMAGLFGSDAPGRIPVPAKAFAATVEDDTGVRTELNKFSCDGEVFFFGELGKAQVTVPFEDVDEVRFEATDDPEWTTAVVKTKAGDEVRIKMDHDRPLYGRAHFGNYRIEVENVRVVDL